METVAVAVPPRSFVSDLRAIRIVWHRDLIRFWRDKPRMLASALQPMLYLFGIGGMIVTVPAFTLLAATRDATTALSIALVPLLVISAYTSISALVKAELFPAAIRTLGVAFPYAIGNTILGGTAEYVALWFKQAGIDATPTTVEVLTADLAKLKAAGWTPIQTGGDWMSSYALQTLALPSVVAQNNDWYQRMSKGELTFSGTYGQAVKTYADWISAGYVN